MQATEMWITDTDSLRSGEDVIGVPDPWKPWISGEFWALLNEGSELELQRVDYIPCEQRLGMHEQRAPMTALHCGSAIRLMITDVPDDHRQQGCL